MRALRAAVPGEIVNAMSVDVEDYFQVSAFDRVVSRHAWGTFDSRVVANTTRVLELFDRAGTRATFFVLGWIAERYPSLIRAIAAQGHEIASHGHHHQLIYTLTPQQFREDVRTSKDELEQIIGAAVLGFRAPSFSVIESSLWALDVLLEEGYAYDASIFPIHHDRYGIPGSPRHAHLLPCAAGSILEMPASTVRIGGVNLPIGGGGYFRMLPYGWTKWGIHRVNRTERQPVVFYFHPWEVDPDQPRVKVSRTAQLRHYTGLRTNAARLQRLIEDFHFDSVAAVLNLQLEPSSARTA